MQKLNLILGSTLLVLLFAGLSARAQVQQAWATTYDGDSVQPEQPDYDQVRAMAVDSAGRVHVTGQSYGSNGTPNIVTIQYSPEGRPLWIASYDAARDSDYPWAMVLDDFGNIYITGTSYGFTTGADVVTLKYDSSGNLLWASRYNGPANSSDSGNAVRVDHSGNVYVTGYSYNSHGDFDVVTIKYDAQGHELWVARYDGPGGGEDRGQGLVVDTNGNAYVTGFSVLNCFLDQDNDTVCRLDGITIKYSSSGQELWVDRYDGAAHLDDSFNAIALDAAGHPVVTGRAATSAGSDHDFVTIKYSPTGQRLWVATEQDAGPINGGGWDIATDTHGNVFVLGIGMQTLKYDSRGRLLWSRQTGGLGAALGAALAVDCAGNAVIAGSTFSGDALDATVVKYDPCGNVVWSFAYSAGPDSRDAAYALALDAAGHAYVGGETRADFFSTPDFFTLKLTQNDAFPTPQVSIHTQRAFTFEAARHANPPAAFVVLRSGATNVSLTVHYAISGTASNGVDYAALSGAVTIPAGQTKASILITAIDDRRREGLETVVLELSPDAAYRLCGKHLAAAYIIDDDLKHPLRAGLK